MTRVATDCRMMIRTHLIELECFDVKGAAMQASPILMSSSIMKPMFFSLILNMRSLFKFPMASSFFLNGITWSF